MMNNDSDYIMMTEDDILDFSIFLYDNQSSIFQDVMIKFINDNQEKLLKRINTETNSYDKNYVNIFAEQYQFNLKEKNSDNLPYKFVLSYYDVLNNKKRIVKYAKAQIFYETYIMWVNNNANYWNDILIEYEPLYVAYRLNLI